MKALRSRLSYANVVSTLCLFLVLGGGAAVAADQLAKNSVGPKQLKKNAVTGVKVKDGAITEAKIADAAVTGAKVKDGSLEAGDLKPGTIPPIPAIPDSYTKTESDARYLRGTIVVVKTLAASIAPDSFEQATVNCPAGYQAVGGGVNPDGIFFGKVSSSGPTVGGKVLHNVTDGQHGPATGWHAAVTTESAGTGTGVVKLGVICSPIG